MTTLLIVALLLALAGALTAIRRLQVRLGECAEHYKYARMTALAAASRALVWQKRAEDAERSLELVLGEADALGLRSGAS